MTDDRRDDAHAEPNLGDEFSRQYLEIRRRLCSYVRFHSPRLDAEAVADEVMARAWKNWERVRKSDSVMGWMFTVAYRLMIDQQKSTSALPREITDKDVAFVAPHADAETRIEFQETLSAMRELPDRLRHALFLSSMCGLTPSEIATVMTCDARSVSRYVSEARRRLKDALGLTGQHRLRTSRPRPLLPEPVARHDSSPDREDENR